MKRHPLTLAYANCINELSPCKEPMNIDSIRAMENEILNIFTQQNTDLKKDFIDYSSLSSTQEVDHIGLNTIGMLADRLSILCIRLYMNSENILTSEGLSDNQIIDIERALTVAKAGTSSTFNKMTIMQDTYMPRSFSEAVMRLAATNLLLWLAQDVLYLRGPESLPDEELRKYIIYFAEKNIARNKMIALSNNLFWDIG
ncbi:hypothetical protein [Synechococcus sp. CC9605]|uniref:hypothetical protein n=1 Tax=Synechococcus sp. (strain CC9605) TaxID=110662 RepID=UPI0012E9F70E|nr:hypothetical protein [Synechococcus sp. CC9605]